LERPVVGPAGGGRSGEPRANDVAQVLEILHHLGAVERLVDQGARPRGIDDELLSEYGAHDKHGEGGGRRQDVTAHDGSSVTRLGLGTVNRRRAAPEWGA